MAKRKSTAHYVDNKQFLQAMKDWREQCEEAEQTGEENPVLEIGNSLEERFKENNGERKKSEEPLAVPDLNIEFDFE